MKRSLLLTSTLAALLASVSLLGCSSARKAQPASVPSGPVSLTLKTVWSSDSGRTPTSNAGLGSFTPAVSDGLAVAANASGTVRAFDLSSGAQRWSVSVGAPIVAGVGSGGGVSEGFFAVVTEPGDLVLIDAKGAIRWKVAAGGVALERPMLSGGRVVVRLADNRLVGWDIESGRRAWVVQRTLPALVLHGQSGLRAMPSADEDISRESLGPGDLLVNLPGGRLLYLSAVTGGVRWEAQVAVPRGSNEVERMSDLMGSPSIEGDAVCVSAYQTQLSCLALDSGRSLWQKTTPVVQPPAVDQSIVAAVDSSSRVLAFNRKTGDALWSNDTLFLRRLTAPISMDRAIWVADMDGYLHGLSREDGKLIARQRLDGGRPSGAMVLTRAGLLVQTEGGRLNLLRP